MSAKLCIAWIFVQSPLGLEFGQCNWRFDLVHTINASAVRCKVDTPLEDEGGFV